MLKNAQRSTFNAQVSVQNLECGDKSCAVRGSRHRFCTSFCHHTRTLKAASRGIPLAAALQVFSPDLRSCRYAVKISASLRYQEVQCYLWSGQYGSVNSRRSR